MRVVEALKQEPQPARPEVAASSRRPVLQRQASSAGLPRENLLQRIAIEAPRAIHDTAEEGTRTAASTFPYAERIQHAFGRHDVRGIQAHLGSAAARSAGSLAAEAYTYGNHAVFSGTPSLFTAAHEAAHAVQQRSGAVSLSGGMGSVGDRWEQNADAVADRVVKGRSAADLLDGIGATAGSGAAAAGAPLPQPAGVQRRLRYRQNVLDLDVFAMWVKKYYRMDPDHEDVVRAARLLHEDVSINFFSMDAIYKYAQRYREQQLDHAEKQPHGKPIPPPLNHLVENNKKKVSFAPQQTQEEDEVEEIQPPRHKREQTQDLPLNANWLDLKKQAEEALPNFEKIFEQLLEIVPATDRTYDFVKRERPPEIKEYLSQQAEMMELEDEPDYDDEDLDESAQQAVNVKHQPPLFREKTAPYSSVAELKGVQRSRQKAYLKYGKNGDRDYSRILDVVRATMSFANMGLMTEAMKIAFVMQKSFDFTIIRCKQTYEPRDETLYGDIKMNLKENKTGHICELQFTVDSFLDAKQAGHVPYNTIRTLNPLGLDRDVLFPLLTGNQRNDYDDAIKMSQKVYGQARTIVETDTNYQRAIDTANWIQRMISLPH